MRENKLGAKLACELIKSKIKRGGSEDIKEKQSNEKSCQYSIENE